MSRPRRGTGPRFERRVRGEGGQVTVLIVLFTVCLVLVIVAVTDLSASYLRRQAATSLADGSALAATDAAAAASVYGAASDRFVAIDPAAEAVHAARPRARRPAHHDHPRRRLGRDADLCRRGAPGQARFGVVRRGPGDRDRPQAARGAGPPRRRQSTWRCWPVQ